MKTRSISVRVTEDEFLLLKKQADACNETPSEFIRNAILHDKKRQDIYILKKIKPIIRDIQTSSNMIAQNIDVQKQTENIRKGVENLCYILI